jgi:hypothetical protein
MWVRLQTMSGYNKTAYFGNPQLTFPAVADERRTLGNAYFVGRMPMEHTEQIGADQYGWSADGNRMAMAKVQATRTAQRLYDRTPRFRVQPTQLMSSQPFFVNHTRDTFAHSPMMGAGSIGALTTPEGQRYRRQILDARAEQFRAMDQDPPTEPPPPTQKELTEKEALKTQYALEFSAILDEFDSGVRERAQVSELAKWVLKFFALLPYYESNETPVLLDYKRQIDSILEILNQLDGADRGDDGAEGRKRRAVADSAVKVLNLFDEVMLRYLGTAEPLTAEVANGRVTGRRVGGEAIIDLPLRERITAVKSILRDVGLRRLKVLPMRPEDEAQDEEDEEEGDDADEFADGGDDGDGAVVAVREPPEYRTQAEITAEVNRRMAEGVSQEEAIRQIAEEWRPFTGYQPRAGTAYRSIRQTLVERIARQGMLAGAGRRLPTPHSVPEMRMGAGRSVHSRLHPHQQMMEVRRQMERLRMRGM